MNEREHIWRDEDGNPVLRHVKYTRDGVKHFPWSTWLDFGTGRWYSGKDPSAVWPLLYPLPTFAKADRSTDIYIVEGEADQEAAQAAGLLAVTAGPAGAFGREHARLFKGWRGRVIIVRDRDLAGAAGALKAFDALRAVGIPASRLWVARGRCKGKGADLRDHLEAGHGPDRLVIERVERLREYVKRTSAVSNPGAALTGGSGDLVRDSDGFLINPHTGFIVAGPPILKKWKPVSS